MHRVKDVIIPDEVCEAMLDAVDKFGVYVYEMNVEVPDVIFVSSYDSSGVDNMLKAESYLQKRCPNITWVASCMNWLQNVEDILINSLWWDDIHD